MNLYLQRIAACSSLCILPTLVAAVHLPIPDPGFGDADGIARVAFDASGNQEDRAGAAVAWVDGRLVLAGSAEVGSQPSPYDVAFARLVSTDGSLDPTFGPDQNGRVLAGLAPVEEVIDIAATTAGLLYLAKVSSSVVVVGRIDADGAADASFDGDGHRFLGAGVFADGGTGVESHRIIDLAGGKILVVGVAINATDVCASAVRLNADGSSDATFGAGSGHVCIAPAMQGTDAAGAFDATVLADGRILLAGGAMHPGGSGLDMSVARLAPDGTLELGFGPDQDGWAHVAFDQGGSLFDAAYSVAVDTEGRIVIAGQIETQSDYEIGIARLLPDGTLDLAFGTGGRVQAGFNPGGHNWDTAHNVFVLPDRHILVGGRTQSNGTVGTALMLRDDGSFEPRFGNGGMFALTDPDGPESGVLNAYRMVLDGDYMYMVGSIISDVLLPGGIRNFDFAATRHVIPLFSDGFDPAGKVPGP